MKSSGNDVLHADEGLLHSYLDGALRPDERHQVESHVAACPTCAAALQEARQLKSQATKILARARPTERARPQPRKMPDRRRKRPLRRLAWAASLLLAIGAGWMARTYINDPLSVLSAFRGSPESGPAEGGAGLATLDDSITTLANATPALEENEAPAPQRARTSRTGGRRDIPSASTPAAKTVDRGLASPQESTAERREGQGGAVPPSAEPLRTQRLAQGRTEEAAPRLPSAVSGPEAAAVADAIAMPRRVYAQPPVEELPGYHVVDTVKGLDPLLIVSQVSAAGDTVVLVYRPADAPDTTRVFDQGVVLERDELGRLARVAGRYRIVGSYRVTATGVGVSRDSLGVLLELLDLR